MWPSLKTSRRLICCFKEKFRIGEEDIKTRGAKALERHRVMEEGYQKALAEYLTLMESLQSSASTVGAYGNTSDQASP